MKSKKILIIVVLLVLVVFVASWAWIIRSTQDELVVTPQADFEGVTFPVTSMPYSITIAPGLDFKIDTGADISSLSEKDANLLRQMGYDVKESRQPVVGRDGYGEHVFSIKRYIVSLPFGGYKQIPDSLGRKRLAYNADSKNRMLNVEFAQTSNEHSSLGLDFLKRFKLEFNHGNRTMSIHGEIPTGYVRVADLHSNVKLQDYLWSPDRIYMIMTINQVPHIFQLDTGLQQAVIKVPSSEISRATHSLRVDSSSTMTHCYKAMVDDRAQIEFGARSGIKSVYYYDNGEDGYQFNPLNVFEQDFVLDIAGRGVYLHPTAKKPAHSNKTKEAGIVKPWTRAN